MVDLSTINVLTLCEAIDILQAKARTVLLDEPKDLHRVQRLKNLIDTLEYNLEEENCHDKGIHLQRD